MSRLSVPAPVAVAFWFGTALAVITYTFKAYVETADGSLGGVTVAPGANVGQQGRQVGRAVGRGDIPEFQSKDDLANTP